MTMRAIEVVRAGDWPSKDTVGVVTLPYDNRHRRRLRLQTDDGQGFLLDLPEATVVRDGDGLRLDDGGFLLVRAADEDIVDVHARTPMQTARIAWHLGNRHLPVEIRPSGYIRFRYDHVIVEMVKGLGGHTHRDKAPFTPEDGAYAGKGGGHHHHHDDD